MIGVDVLHWLVTNRDGTWQTVNAPTSIEALDMARAYGKDAVSAKRIPYPAGTQLNPGKMISLCWDPHNCAGRSSCPKRRACSE